MYNTKSQFSVSSFRCRSLAWIILTVFCASFVPSVGFAQQPTATIKSLSGEVQVSGQTASTGDLLQAGDAISIKAGASVVLALSDGSELHLGQNTELNMADLSQTAGGARVSRISLLAGWLRAFLSPGHQKEGSSFTVETPNAQVGVRFSQPDVEVNYDPEKVETIGIAHTVELLAKNLLTNEEVLVPVGSTVIITGSTIKVITGILTIAEASEAGAGKTAKTIDDSTSKIVETESATKETAVAAGMGKGTMVAIGVGAAAAVGGGIAVVATNSDSGSDSSNDADEDWPFTGTFLAERTNGDDNGSWLENFNFTLIQTDSTSITGTLDAMFTVLSGDPAFIDGEVLNCPVAVTGTANGTSASLSLTELVPCPGGDPTSADCTLENNAEILRATFNEGTQIDFIRQ